MKKYERPVIVVNEELAEGVYAASGVTDGECWTVDVQWAQTVDDNNVNFRVIANHPGTVAHISSASTVTIVFSHNVTSAKFEGFAADVNGNVVTLTRASHGNSYYSADQYNSLLELNTPNAREISVVSSSIVCTKTVNVQGGGADGN